MHNLQFSINKNNPLLLSTKLINVWVLFVSTQCCPQPSLDICLIGMYPFVGSRYVMATEESVVLFTRASRDVFQRSRR